MSRLRRKGERQHYCVDFLAGGSSRDLEEWDKTREAVASNDVTANAVSSEIPGLPSRHLPVLDLDFPCELVESTTPGHFHLYLNGPTCSWDEYANLLKALEACGLIEHGYMTASLDRKATFVRLPGVRKEVAE